MMLGAERLVSQKPEIQGERFSSKDLAEYLWILGQGGIPERNPRSLVLESPLVDVGQELLTRMLADPDEGEHIIWLRSDGKTIDFGDEIYVVGSRGGAAYPDQPPSDRLAVGMGHCHLGISLPSLPDLKPLLQVNQDPFLGLAVIFAAQDCSVLLATPQTRRLPREQLDFLIMAFEETQQDAFAWIGKHQPDLSSDHWLNLYWRSLNFFCSQTGLLLFSNHPGIIR